MREYCSRTNVALPLLRLICLASYVTSVNITAAGAATKSERPLGNNEPGPHVFRYCASACGFSDRRRLCGRSLRRSARAIFAAYVIEPAAVSHDIIRKYSVTAGGINTNLALTAIARPLLPAATSSAGGQDGCELTSGPSSGASDLRAQGK